MRIRINGADAPGAETRMPARVVSWIVLGSLLLSGCMLKPDVPREPPRPYFAIAVDALRDATAVPLKSYVLFPGMEGVNDTDLQYREVARYVRKALAARGFSEAADPASADLALYLNYGIGGPRTTYFAYSYPVLGFQPAEHHILHATTVGEAGKSTITGTIDSFPTTVITGTQTRLAATTLYQRFLVIEAIDIAGSRKAGKTMPIWKTSITSVGTSDDLRRILPALVVAGQPYLGERSDHRIDVQIDEQDPAILALRQTE